MVLCGLCDKPILPLLNYIFLTVVSKSIIRAIQLDIPNLCRESGNIKCHFIQFFLRSLILTYQQNMTISKYCSISLLVGMCQSISHGCEWLYLHSLWFLVNDMKPLRRSPIPTRVRTTVSRVNEKNLMGTENTFAADKNNIGVFFSLKQGHALHHAAFKFRKTGYSNYL